MLFKINSDTDTSFVNELPLIINQSFRHLNDILPVLNPDSTYPLISEGFWSSIDLLDFLLTKTGVADVYIASWSVSENSVRRLVDLKKCGRIKDLFCLFDYRTQLHTPGAVIYASEHFAVKLSSNHAKITVMIGQKLSCVVIGSANYNDNKRIEAGVIFTSEEQAEFFKKFLHDKIFSDGS